MLARLTRRFLALSVTAGVVTGLVLPGTATAAQITIAPGDVTFEQWSRDNTPGWTTGNVGKNYTEGEVIPFRLTVSNAGNTPAGDSFLFSICRDFEEPAAPATVERNGVLRIENYDTTVAAALEGASEGNTINGVTGAGEGATVQILSVTDDTSPATGDCDPGQRETEVEFTVSGLNGSDEAYVLWGGRLASPFDAEVAPRDGATAYSGASLHMTFFPSKTLSANSSHIDEALAPAQLTVTKEIDNRDGGTGEVDDFDVLVDGVERAWGTPISLPAGTYTVSEGPHQGYVSTITGDCAANGSITLIAGQVAECVITNDDIAPPPPAKATLVVTKRVVNNNDGTADAGDFDLFIGTTEVVSGAANVLDPGSYTVSEGDHDGYVSTITGDCAANGSITLIADQVAECIITNDDVAADNPGPTPEPEENPDPEDKPAPSPDPVDPGTNPTEVESSTQTTSNPGQPAPTAPVSSLPTTSAPETTGSQTPAPTLVAELPRTGAGVREQSLLALVLLAAGLLSSAFGRRRNV